MPALSRTQQLRTWLSVLGALAGGLLLAVAVVSAQHFQPGGMGAGQDAHAYWLALRSTAYDAPEGALDAYLYSPAFVQLLAPLLSLPWPVFYGLWTFLLMLALLALSGPVLFVAFLPLAFLDMWGGNITLLMAVAVLVGLRYPGSWSLLLLTKVTPGVGVLWFAARREWRSMLIASAATGAIVLVSGLVDPGAWLAWVAALAHEAGGPPVAGSIPVPLVLRLPLAAGIVIVAGRRDRKWLLPVGTLVAMPELWFGSLTLLMASVAFERERVEARFERVILRALDYLASLGRQVRRAPAGATAPRSLAE